MNKTKYYFDKIKIYIVSLSVILLDQISKEVVIKKIPYHFGNVTIINDFLSFIHVRNKAAGFSLGSNFTGFLRLFFIYLLPICVLGFIAYVLYNRDKYKIKDNIVSFSLAMILGGGIGNMIDRVFRIEGVVDFINVRVFGFLGFEYWPTFNIADSCVVIAVFIIIINDIVKLIKTRGKNCK